MSSPRSTSSLPEPTRVLELGPLRDQLQGPLPADPPPTAPEGPDRRRAVLLLAGVSLLLVAAAYGAGRLVAETPEPPTIGSAAEAAAYAGPVQRVSPARSTATCQSADSVDAAGTPVSYRPAHAHDGDVTTAWRCDGDGVGQSLTITLREETPIAEVGLVPGYAKTDPADGTDRYAENRRITHVRWVFDDGSAFVQRTSGNPADRSLRMLRVPATTTGTVTLQILDSVPGVRDTVAVSEVHLARPTR